MMLDRILRGDDQEGLWQRKSAAIDRHLRFVHRFQQGRLRAGRGAIDLIGQHDIGKNGPVAKLELARLRIVNTHAEDIAGQKVAGELNALE